MARMVRDAPSLFWLCGAFGPSTPSRGMIIGHRRKGWKHGSTRLSAMREFWSKGTPEDQLAVVQIAEKLAPHCHPRLAAVQQDVKHTGKEYQPLLPDYTEEELIARLMAKRQDRESEDRKAY